MKTRFAALFAVCALIGVSVNAEEAVAPAITAPQEAVVDMQKQLEEARAKAKEIEKSLSPYRTKVLADATVKDAKVKLDEAKKAFDEAQRQALTAIPEAADLLTKLDAAKAAEKGLLEKKMTDDKAAKGKKMAEEKAAKVKKAAEEKAAKEKK